MFRKYLTFALIGLLLNLMFYSTATASTEKEARFAEKVKTNIARLGIGRDAHIAVKLKDGTKVKGYVSEISDTGFVVTKEKTGVTVEIPYQQVKQVKGNNLSKGVKIAIGLAVLLALIVLPVLLSKDGI